jgi:anti-anti-sigma regulatory factor
MGLSGIWRERIVPVAIEQSAERSAVRLDGDVGISAALELKSALTEVLAVGQNLTVELAGVTTLDITTLQLLRAAQRAAANAGTAMLLSGPIPEAMELAMGLAGLERFAVNPR